MYFIYFSSFLLVTFSFYLRVYITELYKSRFDILSRAPFIYINIYMNIYAAWCLSLGALSTLRIVLSLSEERYREHTVFALLDYLSLSLPYIIPLL